MLSLPGSSINPGSLPNHNSILEITRAMTPIMVNPETMITYAGEVTVRLIKTKAIPTITSATELLLIFDNVDL